jgi:phosphomannomutase
MAMRKLFGTDGIRGVAGQFPLDKKTVYAIGLAVAHSLRKQRPNPHVLVGMDTRESSTEIAGVLTLGLRQGGAEATSAGVIPQRRRHSHPRRSLPGAYSRIGRRRCDFRLAQSLARQWD